MKQKADNISHGVLLIGLGLLAWTHNWWPNLLVVLGVFFSFRNLLIKNYLKMVTTAIFYAVVYVALQYPLFIAWEYILPLIFFVLGIERILGAFFSQKKKGIHS